MRVSIEERPEPPRMDRRWCVLTTYAPSPEEWKEVQLASSIIGKLGLVPELQVDGDDIALFAARRKKPGTRKE